MADSLFPPGRNYNTEQFYFPGSQPGYRSFSRLSAIITQDKTIFQIINHMGPGVFSRFGFVITRLFLTRLLVIKLFSLFPDYIHLVQAHGLE